MIHKALRKCYVHGVFYRKGDPLKEDASKIGGSRKHFSGFDQDGNIFEEPAKPVAKKAPAKSKKKTEKKEDVPF